MGLDMFLEKETYIGAEYPHRNVRGIIDITEGPDNESMNLSIENLSSLRYKVAYWRKANAIHHWITKDNDNDIEAEITGEKLLELVEICKKVKESLIKGGKHKIKIDNYGKEEEVEVFKNTDLAEELLPSQSGFFFGSTLYNDWYIEDLDETIKQLENINEKDWFIYTASY